jgi:hypothetical protein
MRPGVDIHGFGALGRHHPLNGVFASGRSADDGKCPIAAAGEFFCVCNPSGVDASSDGEIRQHFGILGTHHDHLLWLAATDDEGVMLAIKRQAYRPMSSYGRRL